MDTVKQELTTFWRKFAGMLDSGVPILRALRVTGEETEDKCLKQIIGGLHDDIKKGSDLHSALTRFPEVFPESVRSIMHAAERSGTVCNACRRIADGLGDGTFDVPTKIQIPEGEIRTGDDADQGPAPVRIVAKMIQDAFESRASDIHLDYLSRKLRVRFRIDGVLTAYADLSDEAEAMAETIISRIKIMANVDVGEKRLPQDGRILVSIKKRRLDLRASFAPNVDGECVTLRILDGDLKPPSLDMMGFNDADMSTAKNWIHRPNGLIIVTGPTGCGKTTTLYSFLMEINKPELKVITVEHPVELLLEGINQLQISPGIGLTAAAAMRTSLRQDPDIIMLSEIRDLETAQLVMQAAITGHLVFTTLHTMDAPSAITRLLDIGLDPFLINAVLVGVIGQRLIRVVCPECKDAYTPEPWISDTVKLPANGEYVKGAGCDRCKQTGFRGRTAIHDVLEMDESLKQLVARKASGPEIQAHALSRGMQTLRQDGLAKAAEGLTTIEEALRVCPA